MPRHLLALLFAGLTSLPPVAPAQTLIKSIVTDQPVVALTFDDGPHATNTARLLALFEREGVKATFFEIGDNVAKHPELARAIVAAGHEIGNHSKTHPHLGEMQDRDAVRAELVESQAIIREVTGFTPVVFRAPYFSHGPALARVLEELGLPAITSEVLVNDWDAAVTRDQIIERSSAAGPGDFVLLHTWPDKTVEAMPEIIRRLRAKGLRFVTVSELLALAPKPTEAAVTPDTLE